MRRPPRRSSSMLATVAALTSGMGASCGGAGQLGDRSLGVEPGAAGYPVTVQNCGKPVTFDKAPSRVVTYYSTVEVMAGLGLAGRVVGRLGLEPGLPADQEQAVKSIPEVSRNIPPREKLLSLRPDLVYSPDPLGAAPGQATREEVENAGARVYIGGGHCDPGARSSTATLQDSYDDITNIGKIFGVPSQARAAVDRMKAQVSDTVSRVAGKAPVTIAGYISGEGPLMVPGGGLFNEIVTSAGGRNVLGESNEILFAVGTEQVAAANPEVFLIVDYHFGADPQQSAEFLFRTFPNTPASRARRAVVLQANDVNPGWRNSSAVVRLAQALHPDAFP